MKKLIAVVLFCLGAVLLLSQDTSTKPEGQYCGSVKSNKYHYPSCEWAKKISPSNLIWFKLKEDAEKKNYKPCGVCKP